MDFPCSPRWSNSLLPDSSAKPFYLDGELGVDDQSGWCSGEAGDQRSGFWEIATRQERRGEGQRPGQGREVAGVELGPRAVSQVVKGERAIITPVRAISSRATPA